MSFPVWTWVHSTHGCNCCPYEEGEERYNLYVGGIFRGEVIVKKEDESGQCISAHLYRVGNILDSGEWTGKGAKGFGKHLDGTAQEDWSVQEAMKKIELQIHEYLREMWALAATSSPERIIRPALCENTLEELYSEQEAKYTAINALIEKHAGEKK